MKKPLIKKERKKPNRRKKYLGLKDKFTFGQYKGSQIGIIMLEDPEYIKWCIGNVKWFYLDSIATKNLEALDSFIIDDELSQAFSDICHH